MIEVISSLKIDESEIHFDFIRASGPGGQNVNKVASSVQLRFDVRNSPSLYPDVKDRLIKLAGSRMTDEGVLLIEAKRYRTQEQNRLDAVQRLVSLIQQALIVPKERKVTHPSGGARAARLGDKRKRGETKRIRNYRPDDWE
ncbi:MAG TPA: alternative ribosome rescue aminoacyl-tRNA hydrolase ArfB [Anaerolineaceae bacterium]|nr:alternative ribosome rescue aminoacyl-tRNA hydrolase ArfB [Anaerolineaceae bacterium]HPN53977.1 alternative ribosome rescue aminoacyl-tRNA hydrolase ArfB [Anaerolineaceae bacterium]